MATVTATVVATEPCQTDDSTASLREVATARAAMAAEGAAMVEAVEDTLVAMTDR